MRRQGLAAGLLLFLISRTATAGVLFVGTDMEDFAGTLPDRLGRFSTSGASITGGLVINTPYHINGMADGGGFLFAGDPLSNALRRINYDGVLLSSVTAGFLAQCCSEDMVLVGNDLYHAHWIDRIERLVPATGAVLQTYFQAEIVGMALVGNDIWVSKWGPRQVGKWDPNTNTFTAVFNTPNNAGGLAYDAGAGVLWVGMLGGIVRPYDLAGNVLGSDFTPFPGNTNTIDGLEFVERIGVPEPASLLLLGFGLAGVAAVRRRKQA